MEAFVRELGSQPFRARQLWSWIYKRAEGNVDAMTDLAKAFRAQLRERAEVRVPEVITSKESGATSTGKRTASCTRRVSATW